MLTSGLKIFELHFSRAIHQLSLGVDRSIVRIVLGTRSKSGKVVDFITSIWIYLN